MIITRTPFRISFFGGGTDYPVWYRKNGGVVLSATINKYCYINCRYLPPFFNFKYRLRYNQREETQTIDDIRHPSIRECLRYLAIEKGVEMVHTSDIPAQSGIGSSSAFTVGFLNALYALKGKMVTKRQLAREAIHVEQNLIKENVGSQDQAACAFGGFNRIEFGGERDFYVYPMTISSEKLNRFQESLMLCFTGFTRYANDIAAEQIRNTPGLTRELKDISDLVEEAVNIMNDDLSDLREIGKLFHETWKIKKSLSNLISTDKINEIYDAALSAGALGGKLLGAGGGGFMLFFVPPECQTKVRDALRGLLFVPFGFESLGSQVILYSTQDFF